MSTCTAILLNYNHSAYLPQALDVVLGQTVPFDEILIIDDGSSDGSVDIIKKRIEGIPQARLIVNPRNMGVVPTANAALHLASGDFIFYMSIDDSYSKHMMEWWQPVLRQYPDVAMISGNIRVVNQETGSDRPFILPFPQQIGRYTWDAVEAVARKRNVTFFGGANLIRRSVLLALGGQQAALQWHADWFLYLLVAAHYPFAVVPQEFIRVRQTSDQYSHAIYDWKKQRPVIEAFIHLLREQYPQEYLLFRRSGLLPTYDPQALFLCARDSGLRDYLTPLLVWRLLTYKPLRLAGRLLPDDLCAKIRAFLRV